VAEPDGVEIPTALQRTVSSSTQRPVFKKRLDTTYLHQFPYKSGAGLESTFICSCTTPHDWTSGPGKTPPGHYLSMDSRARADTGTGPLDKLLRRHVTRHNHTGQRSCCAFITTLIAGVRTKWTQCFEVIINGVPYVAPQCRHTFTLPVD
jgi:hypothetical protein